jgi:hypothetical protein
LLSFFPRPAKVYAELLMKRLQQTGAQVYLVNTGWTGGAYGQGQRFSIPTTRAIVSAVLSGRLNNAEFTTLPGFNIAIPKQVIHRLNIGEGAGFLRHRVYEVGDAGVVLFGLQFTHTRIIRPTSAVGDPILTVLLE